MNFSFAIQELKSINELPDYWCEADYRTLLEELDFTDAKTADPSELLELLGMALSDLEPHEAAEVLLKYKLQDKLSANQITNLSHEMEDDNESDVNSDTSLHYPLFNINQLLNSAFSGVFANAKATQMQFELKFKDNGKLLVTKELALKAISQGMNDRNPIVRLFEEQLKGEVAFSDAEEVLWELHNDGEHKYTIITSDYWINREDVVDAEYTGSITLFEEED